MEGTSHIYKGRVGIDVIILRKCLMFCPLLMNEMFILIPCLNTFHSNLLQYFIWLFRNEQFLYYRR